MTPVGASGADKIYGLLRDPRGPSAMLVTFGSDSPGKILSRKPITGVTPPTPFGSSDGVLTSIDFRPSNGKLYGIAQSHVYLTEPVRMRLFTIDPATGRATPVGPAVSQSKRDADLEFWLSFDAVLDQARLIDVRRNGPSDSYDQYRVDPATGVQIDGDPSAEGVQGDGPFRFPEELAAGPLYLGPFSHAGKAGSSGLFGVISIDEDARSTVSYLIQVDPPSSGSVKLVGQLDRQKLGRSSLGALDFGPAGTAYMVVEGAERLVRLDVGAKTLAPASPHSSIAYPIESIPGTDLHTSLEDIAVGEQVADDTDPPTPRLRVKRRILARKLRSAGLKFSATCPDEACYTSARLRLGKRTLGRAKHPSDTLRLNRSGLQALRRDRSRRLQLEVVVEDSAGNRVRRRVAISTS